MSAKNSRIERDAVASLPAPRGRRPISLNSPSADEDRAAAPSIGEMLLGVGKREFQRAVADYLNDNFVDHHSVASAAGVNDKTALNWCLGRNSPGGLPLMKLWTIDPNLPEAIQSRIAQQFLGGAGIDRGTLNDLRVRKGKS